MGHSLNDQLEDTELESLVISTGYNNILAQKCDPVVKQYKLEVWDENGFMGCKGGRIDKIYLA